MPAPAAPPGRRFMVMQSLISVFIFFRTYPDSTQSLNRTGFMGES